MNDLGFRAVLLLVFFALVAFTVESRADTVYTANGGAFAPALPVGPYPSEAAAVAAFGPVCLAHTALTSSHYTGCLVDTVCNTFSGTGGAYNGYFTRDDSAPSGCISLGFFVTQHVCASGLTWSVASSSCVTPPPVCPAGSASGPGFYDMGLTPADPPSAVCAGGCLAIYSGSSVGRRSLVGGVYHYYAEGQYDFVAGSTCTTGPGIPTAASGGPPPDTCGSGQTLGTVNGKATCADSGTGVPSNPNAGAGSPGNTTTKTETPATPPPGGADTSGDGTSITHSPGSPGGGGSAATPPGTTTTTTHTDPATGVKTITTTVTPDDPVKAYCVEHPTAKICQQASDSTFGGTCAAFSCDGDAVQCAIALDQHKRNCTLFDTPTSLSDLGNAAVAGTDTGTSNNPALVGNRVTHAISDIDVSPWLGGSCPADVTTTIYGRSFTLSFASLCSMLSIIGALGVAVSMVIAIRIVGGSFGGN